ncbi:MAG: helix-turn-helix transcriptional regulator [Bacteroidetes bacterium]|nr:helix-turn-helix transcriptional regulator [Bacteroidota bacterium]MBS1739815.1 helix-turn-helix transcriptional regulator [Bacteroidota bacterium]MBS1776893.1 helix-turn-helix transcriptional regulator [Bacteroidota bacterium]
MRHQKTYEELLDLKYGEPGTPKRNEYEGKATIFAVGVMLRDARKEAGLTQEQLAVRLGTQKAYISRIENGKSDIQLSTLYRIFEDGLGKKISISID